jgi:hypothetical protein
VRLLGVFAVVALAVGGFLVGYRGGAAPVELAPAPFCAPELLP